MSHVGKVKVFDKVRSLVNNVRRNKKGMRKKFAAKLMGLKLEKQPGWIKDPFGTSCIAIIFTRPVKVSSFGTNIFVTPKSKILLR